MTSILLLRKSEFWYYNLNTINDQHIANNFIIVFRIVILWPLNIFSNVLQTSAWLQYPYNDSSDWLSGKLGEYCMLNDRNTNRVSQNQLNGLKVAKTDQMPESMMINEHDGQSA